MPDLPVPIRARELARIFNQKLPPYFTRDEVNAILEANAHDPRTHLVINTLWKTGVRVSELRALRRRDLDPYGKVIRVATLKKGVRHEKKNGGPGRPARGNKVSREVERMIPIPDDLVAELMAYMHTSSMKGSDTSELIFPWTRMTLLRIVRKACSMAGIEDERAHPHTFRHSYAVHLIRNQVPITVVKELLGHSNIASTLIYLRIVQPDKKIILDRVVW